MIDEREFQWESEVSPEKVSDLRQGESGTWYLVLDVDGVQISEGSEVDEPALIKRGLSVVTLDHRPHPAEERWDENSQSLVPVTPPTAPIVIDVSGLSDEDRAAVEKIVTVLKSGDSSVVSSVVQSVNTAKEMK